MKSIIVFLVPIICLLGFTSQTDSLSYGMTDAVRYSSQEDSAEAGTRQNGTGTANLKPVCGYRFAIDGDFDGDGNKETLVEHYYSMLEKSETNKYYEGLEDYDRLVDLTVRKKPYSFVVSDNQLIDTLRISTNEQLLGLSFLKNEGDLNGDGNDEVSYVVDWADWSNINTWHIMTYRHNKWQEMYSFTIWDWQLPDLPQNNKDYSCMGLFDGVAVVTDDSTNRLIEKEFNEFQGLVKKIKKNRIRVIRNKNAEVDTAIIDLKHIKREKDFSNY